MHVNVRTSTIALVLLAGVLALGALLSLSPAQTHAALARKVVEACASAENRPLCYDKEIPKLMDDGLSMEETFQVTRVVQELDQSYVYCHVLGHILSEKETAKDPTKWVEVVHRAPSGICSNGAIHGAFQERFRTDSLPEAELEELKPVLRDVCRVSDAWGPTLLEQGSCSHALGHLTMYVTAANIKKSLEACDAVAINEGGHDFRQLCYDGAFMQIYQPLEPEDFDLIAGREVARGERDRFCAQFSGAAYGSCVTESWPLYRDELLTPQGILSFCAPFEAGSEQGERCYLSLFYSQMPWLLFDEGKIVALCRALPADVSAACFKHSASRFIETDWRNIEKAANLCAHAEEEGSGEACYEELITYSTYNFHPGSREALALCRALPEPFAARCRAVQ